MIELSTLTGAMVIALAYTYAGLFCNDDEMSEKLIKAGKEYFFNFSTDEMQWRMPLHEDYVNMMKQEHCDLTNHGGPWGGCSTAAAYLS